MDNNHSSGSASQGKFINGFFLGFLIGAFVVFLLGTKKGKKLLRAISEGGIDNISNILEEAEKTVDSDEVVGKKEILSTKKLVQKEVYVEPARPKARRFFRGISRHAN